jgi:hypothetical protein
VRPIRMVLRFTPGGPPGRACGALLRRPRAGCALEAEVPLQCRRWSGQVGLVGQVGTPHPTT